MIYLDNAATSYPKPEPVYRGIEEFVRAAGANPGRGGHRRSTEAEAMIEETRRLLARLLGCTRPERVIFGLNATDGLNMAIKGIVRQGDHVITTDLEHNSINRPLNRLEQDGIITLTRLPAGEDHLIDPDDLARAFTTRTRLVALTHASNVTGTIQPVRELGRVTRERDALILVDAAQSAGVVPIDVEADCIDLLAFTGHKGLLGPTGTGGLVVGERADVSSWRDGGTGGDSTHPVQPDELPYRLEGGTPNVFGIAGLRAGLRLLIERGVETVLHHEQELIKTFHETLKDPGRYRWHGADRQISEGGGDGRVGLVSLNVDRFAPAEFAAILDEQFDIAVRSGLHCAPYAHRHLGTFPDGTVRLSVGILTTPEDMRNAAAAFDEIAAA
ncbi:MAG: aminotransferase class V-fold PLP-dependent enzyme [Acidobacteriota bacterium]